MPGEIANQFSPDYAVAPGETLLETIEYLGMSQADLATRTGLTRKTINLIVNGKAPITPATAIALERVTDVPARLWLSLESNYRESLERIAERERLEPYVSWLNEIPYRDMVNAGWVQDGYDKVSQMMEALRFFRVADPVQWRDKWLRTEASAAYRRSQVFESNPGAVAAWLCQGERLAADIECAPYDEAGFKRALVEARAATTASPDVFCPDLVRSCAAVGVAVVFVPQVGKTRVSGATRWLAKDKALIQLSLRYKTNDHLWFSFFHEAAHILKHGKRDVFIEAISGTSDDPREKEADQFASDLLIPPAELDRFRDEHRRITAQAVTSFADSLGIAPGIIVGRLQHDDVVPWGTSLNALKVSFEWLRQECA